MVRWNVRVHNNALKGLWEGEPQAADPEKTDNEYIDEIHDELDHDNPLCDIEKSIFRKHYKEKSAVFLMDRAISGTRRRADGDKKGSTTEEKETKLKAAPPTPAPTPVKPASKSIIVPKMTDPNLPNAVMSYSPVHTIHTYTAGKHDRVAILFEAPASFDGSEGSYKVGCFNPKVFSFAIPIQDVFTDPDILHGWLQLRHKRSFGEDSEKTKNWKKVTKDYNDKEAVFTVALPFGCEEEVAGDLTHEGFLFFEPEVSGKKVPLCYVELKSLHKVEQIKKTSKAIVKESFTSPGKTMAKAKGVSGDTASKAMLMQMMMEALKDMPKQASDGKKRGVGGVKSPGGDEYSDAAMEIDDDTKSNLHLLFETMIKGNDAKKKKPAGPKTTGENDDDNDDDDDL